MLLEELISQVHSRQLRLNNLFQLDERRWRANVTDGQRFWEFGEGDGPKAALQAALFKVDTTKPEFVTERPIRAVQDYQHKTTAPVFDAPHDGESVL